MTPGKGILEPIYPNVQPEFLREGQLLRKKGFSEGATGKPRQEDAQ